jgi:hypothetical protein
VRVSRDPACGPSACRAAVKLRVRNRGAKNG